MKIRGLVISCALALAGCSGGGSAAPNPGGPSGSIALSPTSSAQSPIEILAGQSTSISASESGFGGSFSASGGGSANCLSVAMVSPTQVGISPTLLQFAPCTISVTVSDSRGNSAVGYVHVN
jgi:hypothetical protein